MRTRSFKSLGKSTGGRVSPSNDTCNARVTCKILDRTANNLSAVDTAAPFILEDSVTKLQNVVQEMTEKAEDDSLLLMSGLTTSNVLEYSRVKQQVVSDADESVLSVQVDKLGLKNLK